MNVDILKKLTKENVKFFNDVLYNEIENTGASAQIYPNTVLILVQLNDSESPINKAITRPQYFDALERYENSHFSNLPAGRPTKTIRDYNKKRMQQIFNSQHDSRVVMNKKFHKYFHKQITEDLVVFFITIQFIKFNASGRLVKVPGHRSIFLYDKNDNYGYFIDPQHVITEYYYESYSDVVAGNKIIVDAVTGNRINIQQGRENFAELIKNKVELVIPKIIKNPIQAEVFHYTCPQFYVDDKNCVFWSMYLAEELIRAFFGMYTFAEALEAIYIHNPTAESLNALIKNYKRELFQKFLIFNN
jgi:hypothetical protein